jgi:hypothetical protein
MGPRVSDSARQRVGGAEPWLRFRMFRRMAERGLVHFRLSWVLLAFLSILARQVAGATFETTCSVDGHAYSSCVVELQGEIVPGDAAKLERLVRGQIAVARPSIKDFFYLVLNSPGGDVLEAMKIASVARNLLLATTNLNSWRFRDSGNQGEEEANAYECVSACFLVLISGANRVAYSGPGDRARIGLHRPYLSRKAYEKLSPSDLAVQQQTAEELVRDFCRREHVPQRLVDEMMSRSSTQVYWMTRKDVLGIQGYSSWYEELLTMRCGYDKQVVDEGNMEAIAKMMQGSVMPCAANLRGHAQETNSVGGRTIERSSPQR